jgi:hypothetical protein
MTLVLGKVCSDGVIVMSDSKATYSNGLPPTYDNQKVFDLGGWAIAFAGEDIPKLTANAIASTVELIIKRTPGITALDLADFVCRDARSFLTTPNAKMGIVLADSKSLQAIDVNKMEINFAENLAMGTVDDVKFPPPIKVNTVKAFKKYLEETLRLNEGEHIGGPVQTVIIKR